MIRHDVSPDTGILVTCTECPPWFAFRDDRRRAYRAGEAHAVRVHEVPAELASAPRRKWEARHAEDSLGVRGAEDDGFSWDSSSASVLTRPAALSS